MDAAVLCLSVVHMCIRSILLQVFVVTSSQKVQEYSGKCVVPGK